MSQKKQLTDEEKLAAKQAKEARRLAFLQSEKAALVKNKKQEETGKSKAELSRERKSIQEAQREAKKQQENVQKKKDNQLVSGITEKANDEVDFKGKLNESLQYNSSDLIKDVKQQKPFNQLKQQNEITSTSLSTKSQLSRSTKSSPISTDKRGQIFAHIPKRETDLNELTKGLGFNNKLIHSSIIKIGLKMNQNLISDPTNRCIAFLVALKSVIQDYVQPESKQIARDLEQKLDRYVSFLDKCRPLCISMRNVIRIMRSYILKLSPELSLKDAKSNLIDQIDKFKHEEIECGLDGIREHGNLKINQDDVILTFGNSFLIKHIFKKAKNSGKKFRVIVVDSYPRLNGRKLVEFLNKLNIDVTYVLISALSYVMKEVNKVLIEAHTLLANGYMISDMGSSQIALVAKAHNVPVLICCETYKFSERVHTDSFVFNEADSAKDFFLTTHNQNSDLRKLFMDNDQERNQQNSNLNILNLYYDVTPRDFISLVITEMGFLPSTAVPAIIRRNICKFQLDG